MLKKALLINGSPNRKGNNSVVLDAVEKGLEESDAEVHRIEAGLHSIYPCTHCRNCEQNKGCIIKDDMSWIYEKLNISDIIVVSSPIFFNGVAAQFKALVDRCQAIWASKYVLNYPIIDRNKRRKGFAVFTAGQPETRVDFRGAVSVVDMFFKTINTDKTGELFISNVDEKPVKERKELLGQAYRIGRELAN